MKITLITPSFNQAEFIGKTIDSVLSQTGNFELDYVVLDGGSTDKTLEILAAYGNRIRWLSQPDQGQIDAINRGLRAATGDIVGWLNSDDYLLPEALKRIANAFTVNESVQWVYGDCIIVDREGREIRKWVSAFKRSQARHFSIHRLLMSNFISQMTVFWRRELMEKIGYLDDSLPLAFDYDYWLRLAKVSAPTYIDAPQAAFRWYTTSKSGGNIRQQCREDEWIAKRHGLRGVAAFLKRIQNRFRRIAYSILS